MTEIPKTHLIVEARVHHWEGATVNEQEDTSGLLIPLRKGDTWCPVIEIDTGTIIGWPRGTTADINYKVCDDGNYWLGDEHGNKSVKWNGYYVPDKLLAVGSRGFGDYIIVSVDKEGSIVDWKKPDLREEDWEIS